MLKSTDAGEWLRLLRAQWKARHFAQHLQPNPETDVGLPAMRHSIRPPIARVEIRAEMRATFPPGICDEVRRFFGAFRGAGPLISETYDSAPRFTEFPACPDYAMWLLEREEWQ